MVSILGTIIAIMGMYSVFEYLDPLGIYISIWVVVKIMVPFWVLINIRHLVFRGPKRGP